MNLSNGKHALIIIRRVFRGVFVCLSGKCAGAGGDAAAVTDDVGTGEIAERLIGKLLIERCDFLRSAAVGGSAAGGGAGISENHPR